MKTKILPPIFLTLIIIFSGCYKDEFARESGFYGSYDSYGNITNGNTGDPQDPQGETYAEYQENPFVLVTEAPISTFSIDADGASYANVRRFLAADNSLPPQGAVRTEELINYFPLEYADPIDAHPIALNGEVSQCPWTPGNKLVRIGIKGKSIAAANYPASNYVLLIDVSGSMSSANKLDLLKTSFKLLIDEFSAADRIAIVTYAGSAGVVLESTAGNEKSKIKAAIDKLGSGGSTAGAEGIITAYQIAQQNFIEGGNNRIIMATDGDFNVGPSSKEELIKLVEEKRDEGVFLTVVGVGTGNYNDANLEQIADNGNGTYEYIDNVEQAKKVFIHEFSKFFTVAKDVKVQVEFNAALVKSYRLIGYENRLLNTEDFEDDTKDAGEIGAGQNITAIYEIEPVVGSDYRNVPTFTIDFRYKLPTEDVSIPLTMEVQDENLPFEMTSRDMRFTASVAGFGMLLWGSEYKGSLDYDQLQGWLNTTLEYDPYGYRAELLSLVAKAKSL